MHLYAERGGGDENVLKKAHTFTGTMFIIIIVINRIFIQEINHFSPKGTVINVSPVKYCM
jgi:uncharacterized membrane protein